MQKKRRRKRGTDRRKTTKSKRLKRDACGMLPEQTAAKCTPAETPDGENTPRIVFQKRGGEQRGVLYA